MSTKLSSDLRRTLIKLLYKKGDSSESDIFIGIILVSVGSKFFTMIILFRFRDGVNKILIEEQCGFRKGRGCVDQRFPFKLIIEKCLSH